MYNHGVIQCLVKKIISVLHLAARTIVLDLWPERVLLAILLLDSLEQLEAGLHFPELLCQRIFSALLAIA